MPRAVSMSSWNVVIVELRRQRGAVVLLLLWSVLESLPALVSGVLVSAALDRGFLAKDVVAGFGWLGLLGIAMLIRSAATRMSFPYLAGIVEPLRDSLMRMVVAGALGRAMTLASCSDDAAGMAVARVSGHVESARNLFSALLRTLRPTVVSLVLAVVGLVTLSPVVATLTVPFVATSAALFLWSLRGLTRRQRAMILAEERMAQTATTLFTGLRDVAACGAEAAAGDAVDQAARAAARSSMAVAVASSVRVAIVALGVHAPLVLMVALAPGLLSSGELSAGELVGAAMYILGTLEPAVRCLVGVVGTWGRQLAVVLYRIDETSAVPSAGPRRVGRVPTAFDLHVSRLGFAYGPDAEPVIRDLTLDVPFGTHLAVVGQSGIGKSTLAALLAGLVAPGSGVVTLGGIPVDDIPADVLRRCIAVVPQQAYVFTGTLRENLVWLRPEATDPAIDAAVDALGLRPLVERVGGYDTPLGAGGPALSSGERQLIAIARVFLSGAPVVVLDEATCHLDAELEARTELALAATGRTLIVIAHRISSARRAGSVVVLGASSVAIGSPAELSVSSAGYAELTGLWDGLAAVSGTRAEH